MYQHKTQYFVSNIKILAHVVNGVKDLFFKSKDILLIDTFSISIRKEFKSCKTFLFINYELVEYISGL